jgi:hypothetical protein
MNVTRAEGIFFKKRLDFENVFDEEFGHLGVVVFGCRGRVEGSVWGFFLMVIGILRSF